MTGTPASTPTSLPRGVQRLQVALCVIALLLGLALAGMASAQPAPDRTAVLERYRTALVRIEVTGRNAAGQVVQPSLGTGVVVGAKGLILTAGHVVGRDEDWAETAPGSGLRDRTVKVTGLDERGVEYSLGNASIRPIPGYDLALLLIRAEGLQPVPLAERTPNVKASLVGVLWDPGDVPKPLTADLEPTDQARFPGELTVSLRVVEGNSGSGLFDAELRLAGIVVRRIDDRYALAIPAAWVKGLIDTYNGGGTGPAGPTADIAPEPGAKVRFALSGAQVMDVLVDSGVVWVLTTKQASGPTLRNPDGAIYPTKSVSLVKIESIDKVSSIRVTELPMTDAGLIYRNQDKIEVFMVYRTGDGTNYANAGARYIFNASSFYELAVIPVFSGRNWGAYPMFIDGHLKYFSYEGYYWVIDDKPDGDVSPQEAQSDWKIQEAKKSKGILPAESDKIVEGIVNYALRYLHR